MKEIGILGGSSQARELNDYLVSCGFKVLFMAVDKDYVDRSDPLSCDMMAMNDTQYQAGVILGIGAPKLKRDMVERWKGTMFSHFVDDTAWVSTRTALRDGVVVCPNATITCDVKLGRHVLINVGATVSHDVVIDDFSTISPGANVGGRVKIGKGVFVGIGAVIKNDVTIADGAVVGAGAVVIKSVDEPNTVVVGNPARVLRTNDGWLAEI